MTTIAVIPARYGSTRFPGKPLARDTGKYLIQHVYENVAACSRIDRTVVATDDKRIADAVASFGGSVQMTASDHPSGTDRIGEVASSLSLADDDLVLNVQGDEPEIDPAVLDRLIQHMTAESTCRIGTLATPFDDAGPQTGPGSPNDPNCVKVVTDAAGRALYFSRSPIPFPRSTDGKVDRPSRWLLHLGVYAFRADVLQRLTVSGGLVPSELEEIESLEQLRWLENGLPIAVVRVSHRFVGIDTPADYALFVKRFAAGSTCVEA